MTDLHQRLEAWLIDGAPGEPPRDVALHASACDECLLAISGLDALLGTDVEAAGPPPVGQRVASGLPTGLRVARVVSGLAAVVLLVAAASVGIDALRTRSAAPDVASAASTAPIGEGVLGGTPEAAATPEERSESAEPSAEPTQEAPSSFAAETADASPAPVSGTQPPFIAPPPPAVTPEPTTPTTPRPTPRPSAPAPPTPVATPVPTPTSSPPQPTPVPTPPATAEPTTTPTPVPSQAP